jgi:hypothetical protein
MSNATENQNAGTGADAAAVKPTKAKAPKKFKITFHGEGGDVEIAHNFKLNVFKRNVETEIDEHFLGVLKHAVVHTTVDGKEVTLPQHSYTLNGEA